MPKEQTPIDPNSLRRGDHVFIQTKVKSRWDETILFEITKASDPATSESDVRLEFKAVKIGNKGMSPRLASDLDLPRWGRGSEYLFFRCDVSLRLVAYCLTTLVIKAVTYIYRRLKKINERPKVLDQPQARRRSIHRTEPMK